MYRVYNYQVLLSVLYKNVIYYGGLAKTTEETDIGYKKVLPFYLVSIRRLKD